MCQACPQAPAVLLTQCRLLAWPVTPAMGADVHVTIMITVLCPAVGVVSWQAVIAPVL